MPGPPDVSLVVPAHNEGTTIGASVTTWLAAFDRARLCAECVVVDDGSNDDTPTVLAALAREEPRLRVIRQPQSGHGAALVTAYGAARGAWIVQIDGDDEIGAEYFEALWSRRTPDGLVLGRRAPSSRAPVRRLISAVAAVCVGVVSGLRVRDGNVPLRLLPQPLLREFLDVLPPGTFAPNLAMTMFAGLRNWRVHEVPVIERARTAARRPLGGARLWRGVGRALWQILGFARRVRRHSARA